MEIRTQENLIKESTKVLFKNEWVSLCKIRNPQHKIYEYVYSHETRCNGHIVCFVPYRYNGAKKQVLMRLEATPCWNFDIQTPSSFTGGIDEGYTPEQTVVKELLEEAGYKVLESELIHLGQAFGSKSNDAIYHLFAVNLSNKKQEKELTVESELEKSSYNQWVDFDASIDISPDALFHVVINRLSKYLK